MANRPSGYHTTLLIPPDDLERLEQIARSMGFTQTRGAGAGKLGSVSALMRAIAKGTVKFSPRTPDLES